ncbi:hypothetical protein KW807_00870 [Candidatus Parcubacteria bacterium]|nr:hypothetical protein [Candidatus Parcubacteria bacterium]
MMTKGKVITIVLSLLVILVLLGGGFWIYKQAKPEELAAEKAEKLELSQISLEGQIAAVKEGSIVINASRVERSSEGNKVRQYEKEVFLNTQVIFQASVTQTSTEVLSAKEVVSKVRVGDKAVFYGSGTVKSLEADKFTATKITILEKSTLRQAK